MNSNIKKTIIGAALVAACLPLGAQNVNSGYFLDYYTYRHQLNPALCGSDKGFFAFPGLGDLNVGTHGNIHASSIFYSKIGENGKTGLFTNPNVGVQEAMDKFKPENKLGASVREGIINLGFTGVGGYWTIGVNAVANADVCIPKSLFSLMKEGISNQQYDISNVRGEAVGYAEVAINHSRNIRQVPGLRVGLTAKFLVGIAGVDFRLDKAMLELDNRSWNAITNGRIHTSIKGFSYDTKYNEHTGRDYVSGGDIDSFSAPNGFGCAFDLGAEYKWHDFSFSVAALDLGFIDFDESYLASTMGDREVRTDAYTFQLGGEGSQDSWDDLRDNISDLYELSDCGQVGHRYNLKTTINVGIGYELPVYRKLKFGLLNSTRLAGPLTATEFRLSANWQPSRQFSLNASAATGTYGLGFGAMMNIHCTGFNFFLGTDRIPGKLAKQGVPLNSNADVFLGLNFPF